MPQFSNSSGASSPAGQPVYPASVKGNWTVCHADLSVNSSAATAGEQSNPGTVTSTNVTWVKVPDNATRLVLRAKMAVGTTTVTASPVVKVYAAYPVAELGLSSASTSWPANTEFMRVDASTLAASGTTLTLSATADAMIKDATFIYSDPHSITGTDALGGWYIGVLCTTRGNVSGGANSVILCEIMFVN
jgi:hypothetical protein